MAGYVLTFYEKLELLKPLNENVRMSKKPFSSIEKFVLMLFPILDAKDEELLRKCIKDTRQQGDVIREDFAQWSETSFYKKLIEYYNPNAFLPEGKGLGYSEQKKLETEAVQRLGEIIEESVRRISGKKSSGHLSESDLSRCLKMIADCIHEAVEDIGRVEKNFHFNQYDMTFQRYDKLSVQIVAEYLYAYLRYGFTGLYPIDVINVGYISFVEDSQTALLSITKGTLTSFEDMYCVLYSMAEPLKGTSYSEKNSRPNIVAIATLAILEVSKLNNPAADPGECIDNVFHYLRKIEMINNAYPFPFYLRALVQYKYIKLKKTNPNIKVAELEQLLSYGIDEYYLDTARKAETAAKYTIGAAYLLIGEMIEDPDIPTHIKDAIVGVDNKTPNRKKIVNEFKLEQYSYGAVHGNIHAARKIADTLVDMSAAPDTIIAAYERAAVLGSVDAVIELGKIYAGMTSIDMCNQVKAESYFTRAYSMLQREQKMRVAFLILDLYKKNPKTKIPITDMTLQNEYILMNAIAGTLARQYAECFEKKELESIDSDIKLCNEILNRVRELLRAR